jgi:uncharacterized protein (DUF362 family)/Pyruvate/2-oxoacid:ferredoxin oxidoreductase delta subunit
MAVKVALLRCERYDTGEVYRATLRGIELLGGVERYFKKGETILLKPNLLAADPPETASTTHPAVFEAAARLLMDSGMRVTYGDSPIFSDPLKAFKKSGMHEVAQRLNLQMANFDSKRRVFFSKAKQNKVFDIAEGVMAADGILSLPKLKTHALTILTGAVKNQFGCIPGMAKSGFHGKLGTVGEFSQMLVDLTVLLKPRLYVMDGITAMEGNGPRRGSPKHIGALLLSQDPVALDSTAARIVGLKPDRVITIVKGSESGLGLTDGFEIVGDRIEDFKTKFKLPRRAGNEQTVPPLARALFLKLLIPRPVISRARCVKCLECREICPTKPKSILIREDGFPKHNYGTCISCYCCQETCPAGAISARIKPL